MTHGPGGAGRHLQRRPRSVCVVEFGARSRTQDGHIRNDMHDVSRHIPGTRMRAICRRNCVASDGACARVTPGNLHGKEGSTVRVRQRACTKTRNWAYAVACKGEISTLRGYETGALPV